jgi:hypothetical protein
MTNAPNLSDGGIFYAANAYKNLGSYLGTSTGSSSGYVALGSFAVAANSIGNWVDVFIDYSATAQGDNGASPGTSTPSVDLRIGLSGAEASVKTWDPVISTTVTSQVCSTYVQGTLVYNYTPSAALIGSGFNVLVMGKVVDTGAPGGNPGTINISTIQVRGI